jgi:hypothetical protein
MKLFSCAVPSSDLRGELDLATQVIEAADQALNGFALVAAREVLCTEFSIFDAIFQHVIDGP